MVPSSGAPPAAHLEDAVEVLLVHPQEVAVVLPQDDAGCSGSIVHQCQLPKVVPFVQCGHQALQGDRANPNPKPDLTHARLEKWVPVGTEVAARMGWLRGDAPTLPWVTTFTEPFQTMYHEVPLSPWLNTVGGSGGVSGTHSIPHQPPTQQPTARWMRPQVTLIPPIHPCSIGPAGASMRTATPTQPGDAVLGVIPSPSTWHSVGTLTHGAGSLVRLEHQHRCQLPFHLQQRAATLSMEGTHRVTTGSQGWLQWARRTGGCPEGRQWDAGGFGGDGCGAAECSPHSPSWRGEPRL